MVFAIEPLYRSFIAASSAVEQIVRSGYSDREMRRGSFLKLEGVADDPIRRKEDLVGSHTKLHQGLTERQIP